MHLSDGVLEWPVLLGATAVATVGVMWGLRQLPVHRLPQASVLAAIFFVAGTIHIPLGVGSVHLVLSGLLGLLLGWAVFPVLLIGLLLQAALLSFGGFTVLGANLLVLGLPAALTGWLLRPALARLLMAPQSRSSQRALWLGGIAGALSLAGSMLLAALLLWISGGDRWVPLVMLLAVAHLPALLVDSVITALTISAVWRFAPDIGRSLVTEKGVE